MNLGALVRGAMTAIPAGLKCTVTLQNTSGDTTEGTAVGLPGAGGSGDSFEDRTLVRKKVHTFSLQAAGLDFPPAPDMIIRRGSEEWRIIAAPAIDPTGSEPAFYRIMAQR